MAQGIDAVSDIDKVKAEGLATEEEVRAWALTHGYGPGMVDDFVAEWSGDAPASAPIEDDDEDDEDDEDDDDLWDEDDDD